VHERCGDNTSDDRTRLCVVGACVQYCNALQVQQVRSAFRVADEDGSNSMDEAELIKAINLLDLHLSHAQARAWGNQLFAAATPLHKGGIEYAQWVHLVAPYLVRCPEAVATVEHDDRGVVDSRKDLDWHKKRQGGVSAAARMVARGVIGTSIQPPIYKVIRQVPVTSKQSIEAIVRLQARVGALDRMVKREQVCLYRSTYCLGLSIYLPVCLCIHVSICRLVCPSISQSVDVYFSVCRCLFLSLSMSLSQSVDVSLTVCLCLFLSLSMSLSQSVYVSLCLSVCLSVLSVYLAACGCLCLCLRLRLRLRLHLRLHLRQHCCMFAYFVLRMSVCG